MNNQQNYWAQLKENRDKLSEQFKKRYGEDVLYPEINPRDVRDSEKVKPFFDQFERLKAEEGLSDYDISISPNYKVPKNHAGEYDPTYGVVAFTPGYGAPVVAHELGHASQQIAGLPIGSNVPLSPEYHKTHFGGIYTDYEKQRLQEMLNNQPSRWSLLKKKMTPDEYNRKMANQRKILLRQQLGPDIPLDPEHPYLPFGIYPDTDPRMQEYRRTLDLDVFKPKPKVPDIFPLKPLYPPG